MSWTCKICGEVHENVAFSFAASYPSNYANMAPDERNLRAIIGSDQCVIDEREFYIRGCLEIPIRDHEEVFLWGLWAQIWEEDYDEISEAWEEQGRETRRGPYKGRLANSVRQYDPATANLKLTIRLQPLGQRPLFIIEEPEHPLAISQANGLTYEEACDLSERVLHNQ